MGVIRKNRCQKPRYSNIFRRLLKQMKYKERTCVRFSLEVKILKDCMICQKIEEISSMLSGAFVLASSVSSEDTCRGELAEFMADHILSNINRNELVAVMHCDSKSDKVGRNHRSA
jgi:hypothetical protein